MVLGVCRRLLGVGCRRRRRFPGRPPHLRPERLPLAHPEKVAAWLHGGLRYAWRMWAERARRHERETTMVETGRPPSRRRTPATRRILDEELDRLPEKYRLPIVLCEPGEDADEAAKLLGLAQGSSSPAACRAAATRPLRCPPRGQLDLPIFLGSSLIVPDSLVALTLATTGGLGRTPHIAALADAQGKTRTAAARPADGPAARGGCWLDSPGTSRTPLWGRPGSSAQASQGGCHP